MSAPSTEVKSIQQVVKERLEGQVANLIPEEAFAAMIDKAVKSLVDPQLVDPRYPGQGKKGSVIEEMIAAEIQKQMKPRIEKVFGGEEWQQRFDENETQAPKAIEKMIEKHGATIFTKWMSDSMTSAVEQTIHNMKHNTGGTF